MKRKIAFTRLEGSSDILTEALGKLPIVAEAV